MFRMRAAQSTYPVVPKEEGREKRVVNCQLSTVNNTVGFERIFVQISRSILKSGDRFTAFGCQHPISEIID